MMAYWIKFTDGSEACCEGRTGSEFAAKHIQKMVEP